MMPDGGCLRGTRDMTQFEPTDEKSCAVSNSNRAGTEQQRWPPAANVECRPV